MSAEGSPSQSLASIVGELQVPALPAGSTSLGVLALIKIDEPDGGVGWVVRVTPDLDDDEVLGALTGYVKHLTRVAADSWRDFAETRLQAE